MTISLDDVEMLGRVLHTEAQLLAQEFPGSLADLGLAHVLHATANRWVNHPTLSALAEALVAGYGQIATLEDADLYTTAFDAERFLE